MEPNTQNSEANRSPVSKGLALFATSLALVVVNKEPAASQHSPDPLVKTYHEINFAKSDQPEGLLAYASNSSTTLYPHQALHKYCVNIAGNNPKDKVKYGVFNFFREKRLTPAQAAGIDGNFGQESDWDTGDAGGLLAQWGGERLAAEENLASRLGKSATSLRVQLKYTWLELTGGQGAGEDDSTVLKHLKGTKTAAEAATVFSNEYERPSIPALGNRIQYAEQILHKFGHLACNDQTRGPKARIAVPLS
jgi:hypothetical protein